MGGLSPISMILSRKIGGGAFTNFGDECSLATNAPYGANPAKNSKGVAGAANTLAICEAQMTPNGTAAFYTTSAQAAGTATSVIFTRQHGTPTPPANPSRTSSEATSHRIPKDHIRASA